MQNKGFVKLFAVALTLICAFYLSFSVVSNYYEGKAEEIRAAKGDDAAQSYLDSLTNERVYLGQWTLKDCREMGIGLGLDLKGGMNVILEVSVPDVVRTLADHKQTPAFNQALEAASKSAAGDGNEFVAQFVKAYKAQNPDSRLAELFATQQLKGKVHSQSTDEEVERVLKEEVDAAVKNSFTVIRNRIDRFGVVQPNIQQVKGNAGRIMVEMPGIKEPDRVRKLLQGSANLEFWETYNTDEVIGFVGELNSALAAVAAVEGDTVTVETVETEEVLAAEATQADENIDIAAALKNQSAEAQVAGEMDEEALAIAKKQNPLFSLLQPMQGNMGCVVGYAHRRDTAEINTLLATPEAKAILPSDLSLKWGVKGIGEGAASEVFELYAIRITERNGRAPLEGDVIVSANDEFDPNSNQPCVSMQMNVDGARRWAALTKANQKRCIAIVLDNYVYSAPTVQNEITGGNSQITGNFTVEDTRDLANVLRSGKMPAPAHIVSEEVVGPTLGAESIRAGVISFVVALVVLMLYMLAMYGFIPGMVANCALVANFFFTLGILTSFQAALTMSGIAGLVLSLGMAVDANVLIYERTKEELRAGKKLRSALADGYSNAFSAIFDSNLTSIITGVILYWFGTGPIRGFATTLIIGILVSFFTAVFLTRLVYEGRMAKDKWLNLTFETPLSKNFFRDPKYNFMGAYKKSFAIFGVIALVGVLGMVVRGFSRSIDFTGGRNFVVEFEKQVEPETVRELLNGQLADATTQVIAFGNDGQTVRISTNYRIEDEGVEVDSEIEAKLFEVLKDGKLLAEDLDLQTFINRDDRRGGSIVTSQKVGASVADDMTRDAIISVVLALIAIGAYILLRFRSIAFSVGALTALTVDTLIILGAYALCWGWMPFSLEIDQTFIGAVLTAIGYSINDKVVVFDRIREFMGLYPNRDRRQLFNESINSTLTRTINTSFSTLIVLLMIFIFGGASIRSFAFAMILGVVGGTLSSIFMAAPVAYLCLGKVAERKARKAAAGKK